MMVWAKLICLLIVINSCAFSIPLGKKQREGKFLSIFSLVSFEVRNGRNCNNWILEFEVIFSYHIWLHRLNLAILLQNTICNGTTSTTADNPICIDQGKFLFPTIHLRFILKFWWQLFDHSIYSSNLYF